MSMKLPTRLSIMGQQWELLDEEVDLDEPGTFGDTRDKTRTISIYRRPHRDFPRRGSIQSTLLHECVHACLISAGIDGLLEDKLEEAVVLAIETGLFPLIQKGLFTLPKGKVRL